MNHLQLVKKQTVLHLCAISKSTLYRLIAKGEFPSPVSLTGGRSVAWRMSEVEAWINSRQPVIEMNLEENK